jgi:hypothetical protein
MVPHEDNRSYRDVLRSWHVAGLLLGDLLANAGTGMLIVAMPVQTLSIHGSVPKATPSGWSRRLHLSSPPSWHCRSD